MNAHEGGTMIWARLLQEDSGQDMVEYALVAALVGLGAVASLRSLTAVFGKMVQVGTQLVTLVWGG